MFKTAPRSFFSIVLRVGEAAVVAAGALALLESVANAAASAASAASARATTACTEKREKKAPGQARGKALGVGSYLEMKAQSRESTRENRSRWGAKHTSTAAAVATTTSTAS